MKKFVLMILISSMSLLFFSCGSNTSKTSNNVSGKTVNSSKIIDSSSKTSTITKETESNFYEALDKLPQDYPAQLAEKNGDVVEIHIKSFVNIDKMDKFIEDLQNAKENMIRITRYTDEGDAVIYDLTRNSDGIKLIKDNTRDKYSSSDMKIRQEYKVTDVFKKNDNKFTSYIVKTDKGEEISLCYSENK